MDSPPQILDQIAVTDDISELGLERGQVGTIIATVRPGLYDVEFSDPKGRVYAACPLRSDQILILRYQPLRVR